MEHGLFTGRYPSGGFGVIPRSSHSSAIRDAGGVRFEWRAAAMKFLAILGFACMLCQPASALNCAEVRDYVQTYGAAAVLAYGKRVGMSAQQIRAGKACLYRGWKSGFRRSASR
jgi:hypothetical protein